MSHLSSFTLLKLLEKTVNQAKLLAQSKESTAADRKLYERVASWAGELTIKQMLDWFDCVEHVNVKNKQAHYRWSTETTKRDQAFLDLSPANPLSVGDAAFRIKKTAACHPVIGERKYRIGRPPNSSPTKQPLGEVRLRSTFWRNEGLAHPHGSGNES